MCPLWPWVRASCIQPIRARVQPAQIVFSQSGAWFSVYTSVSNGSTLLNNSTIQESPAKQIY